MKTLLKLFLLLCVFEGSIISAYASTHSEDNYEKLIKITYKKSLSSIKELRKEHPDLTTLASDKPSCFLSYAWGSKEHEDTVHRLGKDLKKAGINVKLDIWNNRAGTEIHRFTEEIDKVDFVVIAGTKTLMVKYEKEGPVVNLEIPQIADKIRKHRGSVIPIILEGDKETSLPSLLRTLAFIEFQQKENYFKNVFQLLSLLYKLKADDIFMKDITKAFSKKQKIYLGMTPEERTPYLERLQQQKKEEDALVKEGMIDDFEEVLKLKEKQLEEKKKKINKSAGKETNKEPVLETDKDKQTKPSYDSTLVSLPSIGPSVPQEEIKQPSPVSRKKQLEQKANSDDAQAQYELGVMFRDGAEIRKRPEEALAWFEKAAADGHQEAERTLELLNAHTNSNTRQSMSTKSSDIEEIKEENTCISEQTLKQPTRQEEVVPSDISSKESQIIDEDKSFEKSEHPKGTKKNDIPKLTSKDQRPKSGISSCLNPWTLTATGIGLLAVSATIYNKLWPDKSYLIDSSTPCNTSFLRNGICYACDNGTQPLIQHNLFYLANDGCPQKLDSGLVYSLGKESEVEYRNYITNLRNVTFLEDQKSIIQSCLEGLRNVSSSALARIGITTNVNKEENRHRAAFFSFQLQKEDSYEGSNHKICKYNVIENGLPREHSLTAHFVYPARINILNIHDIFVAVNKVKAKLLTIEEFATFVTSDPTLTTLDFTGNQIGDEGAKALAGALLKNTTLTLLNLNENNIGTLGVIEIGASLAINKALESLSLLNNHSGDDGATEIAKALKKNTTLTALTLYNNNIGHTGAINIAEALKENRSLKNLHLGCNIITDQGAQEIAKALKKNKSLTTLFLNNTGLSDRVINDFKSALEENQTLTYLDLSDHNPTNLGLPHNTITNEGVKVLVEAFKKNKTLTSLDLRGLNISEETKQILRNLMQIRPSLEIKI